MQTSVFMVQLSVFVVQLSVFTVQSSVFVCGPTEHVLSLCMYDVSCMFMCPLVCLQLSRSCVCWCVWGIG